MLQGYKTGYTEYVVNTVQYKANRTHCPPLFLSNCIVGCASDKEDKPTMKQLETDYLLVGAGAFGMAFLDELINNTKDTTVVVVDNRAKPGGHWNDAYPFVRLHQPAATYGVNSRPLGKGGADLASKYQILAYYEQVMEDLLATGRVSYYPLCEYVEEGRIVSLLDSDLKYEVKVKKKTVNATCLTTDVPATRPPQYGVADGVNLVPINGLADIKEPWQRYLVIGAGKTGLDALIFLLDQNVDPDKISWVVSNDCWYINRSYLDAGNICKFVKPLYRVDETWSPTDAK